MNHPTEAAVKAPTPDPVLFDWSMAALIALGVGFVGVFAWLAMSGSAFLS